MTVGHRQEPRCTVVSGGLKTSSKSNACEAYPFARAAYGPPVRCAEPTMVATGSEQTEAMTSRSLTDAGSAEPASTAANQSTSARLAPCTTDGGTFAVVTDEAKSANNLVLVGFSVAWVMCTKQCSRRGAWWRR